MRKRLNEVFRYPLLPQCQGPKLSPMSQLRSIDAIVVRVEKVMSGRAPVLRAASFGWPHAGSQADPPDPDRLARLHPASPEENPRRLLAAPARARASRR